MELEEVYSVDGARNWFLSHSSGSVICVMGLEEKEVDNFIDAEEFFKKSGK